MKKTTIYSIAALIAIASPAAIAQDKGKTETTKAKTEVKGKDGEKKAEEKFDVELKLEGADALTFNKTAFTVKSGQQVKLTLKHVGQVPKIAMGHNVAVIAKGTDITKLGEAIVKNSTLAEGYIPKDKKLKAKILAHTKLLGPGETDSIIFTAPAPGKYDYICTFPGHYLAMKGVLTVEAADKKGDAKKEATVEKK